MKSVRRLLELLLPSHRTESERGRLADAKAWCSLKLTAKRTPLNEEEGNERLPYEGQDLKAASYRSDRWPMLKRARASANCARIHVVTRTAPGASPL